jgi:hypothetical protein
MKASTRIALRAAMGVSFVATAALAVTLESHAPLHAALTAERSGPRTNTCAGHLDIWLGLEATSRLTNGTWPMARYTLEFTNVSHASCTLSGYPGVAAYGGRSGLRIGNAAGLDTAVAVVRVLLAPGATAHTEGELAGFRGAGCRPVTASALRVWLPGQRQSGYVPYQFPACSAAGAGAPVFLRVEAIQPGTGIPGYLDG